MLIVENSSILKLNITSDKYLIFGIY